MRRGNRIVEVRRHHVPVAGSFDSNTVRRVHLYDNDRLRMGVTDYDPTAVHAVCLCHDALPATAVIPRSSQ